MTSPFCAFARISVRVFFGTRFKRVVKSSMPAFLASASSFTFFSFGSLRKLSMTFCVPFCASLLSTLGLIVVVGFFSSSSTSFLTCLASSTTLSADFLNSSSILSPVFSPIADKILLICSLSDSSCCVLTSKSIVIVESAIY